MNKSLATMEQIDMIERMELQRFAQKVDQNRRMTEYALMAQALQHERKCRKRERKKHRQELDGMVAFITLAVCLTVMVACALSSAPWTAILAIGCAVAVMWKGGWIA